MQTFQTVSEMKQAAAAWRAAGQTVALVPTMASLHTGQEAVIRAAAQKADVTVVSAFVNPLQFAPNELMVNYPRSPEADVQLCAAAGAAAMFVPTVETMYPPGYSTYVTEEALSKSLCGLSRPNHFRGVTTMVAKLLNIVRPHYLFFGQKTAQRAAVARKLVKDLCFDTEIVVVPTVRETDGLAAGIPNPGFTPSQRQEALAINQALQKVQEMSAAGVRNPDRLIAEATHILGQRRRVRVIYVAVVDRESMEPMREVVPGRSLIAISAWIDEVRLIDNALL